MRKILCLLVMLSLLIVGCGEEKNEVKPSASDVALVSTKKDVEEDVSVIQKEVNSVPVSKKVSSSTKEEKEKKMTIMYLGMRKNDWTPDSVLKFLNTLYDGRVTMEERRDSGTLKHLYGNKIVLTDLDKNTYREVPNIDSLEGKFPEALYFIDGNYTPCFLLKYKTLWFATGLSYCGKKDDIQECFIYGVHIGSFMKYHDNLGGMLPMDATGAFKQSFEILYNAL